MKKFPKFPWYAALLVIAGAVAGPASGDCPGCQYAPLYPLAEIAILDLPATVAWEIGGYVFDRPISFGRSLGLGAAGGALGFAAGSLLAAPFLRDAFGSMVWGGLLVGIPVGVLVGQVLAVPPKVKDESARMPTPAIRWSCLPLPGGGRMELRYVF